VLVLTSVDISDASIGMCTCHIWFKIERVNEVGNRAVVITTFSVG
jgi:hypothetical protein